MSIALECQLFLALDFFLNSRNTPSSFSAKLEVEERSYKPNFYIVIYPIFYRNTISGKKGRLRKLDITNTQNIKDIYLPFPNIL